MRLTVSLFAVELIMGFCRAENIWTNLRLACDIDYLTNNFSCLTSISDELADCIDEFNTTLADSINKNIKQIIEANMTIEQLHNPDAQRCFCCNFHLYRQCLLDAVLQLECPSEPDLSDQVDRLFVEITSSDQFAGGCRFFPAEKAPCVMPFWVIIIVVISGLGFIANFLFFGYWCWRNRWQYL